MKEAIHSSGGNVTGVTKYGRKKIWNLTEAFEPETKHRNPEMIPPTAIHRYALILFTIATGIALAVLSEHSPMTGHMAIAIGFGWCVGQLWRWEPPR